MSHHPIPHHALVVVADGAKAIFLRNVGHGGQVSLQEERRVTGKSLFEDGPSGSRPGDQTPRQTDEATFAKQLAHSLYSLRNNGDFESLVLVLDPQTLGQLRSAMHKTVEVSVVRTVAKDLTNHTIADITHALAE